MREQKTLPSSTSAEDDIVWVPMTRDITQFVQRRQRQIKVVKETSKGISLGLAILILYGIGAGFTYRKHQQWFPDDNTYNEGEYFIAIMWPIALPLMTGVHIANPPTRQMEY